MSISAIVEIALQAIQFAAKHGEDIRKLIEVGKPVAIAIKDAAPEALPIFKKFAIELFPGLNPQEALEAFGQLALRGEKDWSPEERQRWFDQATGDPTA